MLMITMHVPLILSAGSRVTSVLTTSIPTYYEESDNALPGCFTTRGTTG